MERKQEENCGARREVNKQNLRHLVLLVSKETLFFFEPLDGAGVVVEGAVRAFLRGKEGEKKIDVHNSIVIIRVVAHRKGYSQRILQISSQIDNNERHGLIRVLLFLRMSMRRIAINLCAHKQWYRDGWLQSAGRLASYAFSNAYQNGRFGLRVVGPSGPANLQPDQSSIRMVIIFRFFFCPKKKLKKRTVCFVPLFLPCQEQYDGGNWSIDRL